MKSSLTSSELPTDDNTNMVIATRQLNHYFGQGSLQKQVLFDVNLEIQGGEIVILTGPSGSGKTTLLTLLGGLRSPSIRTRTL